MGETLVDAALLRVHADVRKSNAEKTGVGHYVANVVKELRDQVDLLDVAGEGAKFHLSAVVKVLKDRDAVYFSPESLIVPAVVGRRAVLVIHDLTTVLYPDRHTKRNRIFHKLFLRAATMRVGAIIVPTDRVRDDLVLYSHASARKIRVVHEGNRIAVVATRDTTRIRSVLYIGTIEPRKNVRALIRAFSAAAGAEGWTLDIVGRMGWVSAYEKNDFCRLVEEDDRITYHGYVSDGELVERLRLASIFCYLSESEGFGLPVLEAMASGLPCVISDDPALLEVAGGHAVVVGRGPKLVEETTAALTTLIADAALRAELGAKGVERSGEFSWKSHAQAVAEVLHEVGQATRGASS